jgi:hypothetical protein
LVPVKTFVGTNPNQLPTLELACHSEQSEESQLNLPDNSDFFTLVSD